MRKAIMQGKIMRRVAGPAFLVSFLVAFLVTPAVFGYVRQVTSDAAAVPLVRVDNTAIQFYLNNQIVPGYQTSASGSAVTVVTSDSNPVDAVRKALATWNAVGTANVKFLPLVSTQAVIDPNDFQATIAFGSTAAELSAVGGALALTVDSYVTSPANRDPNQGLVSCNANCTYPAGGITDSDIILNPAYTFSTTGAANTHDLQAVLLHELGHSLGANHTGILGASMFQFPTQRYLTTDDLAFVNSVYPGGGAALGTIGGTVTTSNGAGVPYALLTAFDAAAGVTAGGMTNPDGTYSFQVPPGNYRLYAEPLNGAVPIYVYLTSTQASLAAATKFQTTTYSGALNIAANSTATANITVNAGATNIATPLLAVTPVGGTVTTGVNGGPVTVPSGGQVDLVLSGAGFDSTLSDANFVFYGQGISLQPGTVRVDKSEQFGAFYLLRLTLNVAATTTPSLASFVVINGSNVLSFSGALVIVPPTPTFTAQGVISAAAYQGIQSGVSPGGIYSIYDVPGAPNLGPATYVLNGPYDAYKQLPSTLAGVTVTFDGVPAPMFLSWGNQLNFQVPFEVAGKTSTQVIVNYLGSSSAPIAVPVLPAQPSLFTSNGTAVSAYNLADHTINSVQNPAARGTYVEVYGTGVGKVNYTVLGTNVQVSGTGAGKATYTVLTGQGAPAPPSGYTGNYTYSIGGSAAAPAYFGGWTPTAVGLAQWDLLIPASSPTGAVSIIVHDANGASSQSSAVIYVK